jgi:hypothetical protein
VQDEATIGRTPLEAMRAGVRPKAGSRETPQPFSMRPRPSDRRADEDRERRHRERTIASWLRSLSR